MDTGAPVASGDYIAKIWDASSGLLPKINGNAGLLKLTHDTDNL
jgi:hypothetical protein